MDYLITGVHRSGTSVAAHWLSGATGGSLLDDPDWAITAEGGFASIRTSPSALKDLQQHSVVKCPRAITDLPSLSIDFPETTFVVMFRQPMDVMSSILEAALTGNASPVTMIDLHTKNDNFIAGFCDYYHEAYSNVLDLLARKGEPLLHLLDYSALFRERSTYLERRLGIAGSTEFDFSRQYSPMDNNLAETVVGPGRASLNLVRELSEMVSHQVDDVYLALKQASEDQSECST